MVIIGVMIFFQERELNKELDRGVTKYVPSRGVVFVLNASLACSFVLLPTPY